MKKDKSIQSFDYWNDKVIDFKKRITDIFDEAASCDETAIFGETNIDINIGNVATADEIEKIEKKYNYTLPPEFKACLLNYAKAIDIYWYFMLKREGKAGKHSFWFYYDIDKLDEINSQIESMTVEGIAEEYSATEEYCNVWLNKFGFMEAAEYGDLLAFDTKTNKIVYLQHDGDDLHGLILADDFDEFFEKCINILFLHYDYDSVLFNKTNIKMIDNAQKLIEFLNKNIKVNTKKETLFEKLIPIIVLTTLALLFIFIMVMAILDFLGII